MTVLAALILGTWWQWGGDWERGFGWEGSVRVLRGAGHWAWAVGVGLLVADLVLPVPGTVVISALGFIYGTWLGGAIAAGGLLAAGMAGYGVGRLFGENWGRRILGERDWERGGRLFAKQGGWVVAASRALPILPEVISCTAGLVRMPFSRFFVSLVCGSFPMGFTFAAIGRVGHDAAGWAVGLSVAIPVLLWAVANRWLRSRD